MAPTIKHFKILDFLGKGSSGTVHKAIYLPDGRSYAVKILDEHVNDLSTLTHLIELNHPHLLTPLSIEETTTGKTCLVFPLVQRVDARQLVEDGGPIQALSLLIQACGALNYLHSHEIVHGDIKPQNVLCELNEPGAPFPARLLLSDLDYAMKSVGLASSGTTGTLGYLAPEVIAGEPCSSASDVFSLGAWAYWLITGTQPFFGDSISSSLLRAQTGLYLAAPARLDKRFSASFWGELLNKLTSIEPKHRFSNGGYALRFILENTSTVEDLRSTASNLIWNPNALMPHELELEKQVRKYVMSPLIKPRVVILRGGRHNANIEIARRLSAATSGKASTVIGADILKRKGLDLTSNQSQTIVIDIAGESGMFRKSELAMILRLLALQATPRGGSIKVVILLSSSEIDVTEEDWGPFDVVTFTGVSPIDFTIKDFRSLFSGIELDSRLLAALTNAGCKTANLVLMALAKALEWNSLSVTSGEIGFNPKKESDFLVRVEKLVREVLQSQVLSSGIGVLLELLPGGLTQESVAHLVERDDGIRSLVSGEAGDGFRWSIDRTRLTSLNAGRRSEDLTEELRVKVGRVCDILMKRWGEDQKPQSEEELVCRVYGSKPTQRNIRRVVAYAWLMLRRGMVSQAGALLLSGSPPSEWKHALSARWCEVRSRIFNSAARFDDALREAESACGFYALCNRELLAGRLLLDLSIEAGGWSRPDLGDSLRERSKALLASAGKRGERLLQLAVGEDAQSAFVLNNLDSAESMLDEVLKKGHLDSRAGAVCFRLLALISLRRLDVGRARRHYCSAIRAAEKSRDYRSRGRVLVSVGAFHFQRGYYSRGEKLFRRVLKFPRGSICNSEEYAAWTGLGGVAYEAGKYGEALNVNMRALALCSATRDEVRLGHAESNVALILQQMGRICESQAVAMSAVEKGESRWQGKLFRIIGCNYSELGEFVLANQYLKNGLARESNGRNLAVRINILNDLATMEHDREDGLNAIRYASEARDLAVQLSARDELLDAEYLCALYDPSLDNEGRVARLNELLDGSDSRLNFRTDERIQATIAELDTTIPVSDRLKTIDTLLQRAVMNGFGSFVMKLLEIKARLLIENRESEKALDVLRECLNRVKVVADGLSDPVLRKVYLADPRRQKILEMIRMAKAH